MRGVVTIATHDPAYAVMADNLVASLRGAGQYEGPIVVLSDLPEAAFGEKTRQTTKICVVSHGMDDRFSSRWAKTGMATLTPFDTTLYLDADVTAMAPMGEVWEFANKGDAWMVRNPTQPRWPRGITPPPYSQVTYYNGGVLLWNSCDRTMALFEAWRAEWERAKTTDQIPLAMAQLSTRVVPGELPARFNEKRDKDRAVFWHPRLIPKTK